MNRLRAITFIIVVLLLPSILFAASKFSPADAVIGRDNTVTVPLVVKNNDGLIAMDIPLKYSEGVILKEVTFENTRIEYFDLKLANINHSANTVIIGLIHQASAKPKPLLMAGEGTVANLVFSIEDPTITSINIEAIELEDPNHSLLYLYSDANGDYRSDIPEFAGVTISLSGIDAGSTLPTEYVVDQNYPNPFNPSTQISLALPSASNVDISIYNVLGQKVRQLVRENLPAGYHTITWDGRSSSGSTVSSGIYFYRVETAFGSESKKMLLLK